MANRRNFLKTIVGVVTGAAVGTDLVRQQMQEVETRAVEKEVLIPSAPSPLSGFGFADGWCAPAGTVYDAPLLIGDKIVDLPAVQMKRGGITFKEKS